MGGSSGLQGLDGRRLVVVFGVLAGLLVGCSSGKGSDAASTATSSTSTSSGTSGNALVGTWTGVRTFVPVGCPVSEAGSDDSCPPATRKGWEEVRMLNVGSDGTATVRFSDIDGSITTTCTGHLDTSGGVALSKLSCHGDSPVDTAGFASPVKATVSGGCLELPDNAQFERHPGDCTAASSASTVTFAPAGTGG
jgi:hypothetical protein